MDNNLKEILEEFEILKGQFVITSSWEIERLIAIGEDDQDYYWVTYNLCGPGYAPQGLS